MTPAPLKALMVDVDGVVLVPQPGGWGRDLEADLGLSLPRLQSEFFAQHWPDIEVGRAGLEERLAPVLARIAPHLSCEALTRYWFEKDANPDASLLEDLRRVRAAGLQVHLATVQEHRRAAYIWQTLRFNEQFEAIHYSAALGAKKPHSAFFRAIELRTGLAGQELMLIDDRVENVEGAQICGWRAALWDGRRTLFEILTDEGFSL